MCTAGAQSPFENVLRPLFSITTHHGPAAFTRRVRPASPGGKHAHPSGGDLSDPSGARNTCGSAVGESVRESAIGRRFYHPRSDHGLDGALVGRHPDPVPGVLLNVSPFTL